jgi:hypothetical protein
MTMSADRSRPNMASERKMGKMSSPTMCPRLSAGKKHAGKISLEDPFRLVGLDPEIPSKG